MLDVFLKAIALLLLVEGVLPFTMPHRWRRMMLLMSRMPESSLRLYGLLSMSVGLLVLLISNQWLLTDTV